MAHPVAPDDASRPMLDGSFDVLPPASGRALAAPRPPAMAPPPAPPAWQVFKVVVRKHFFLARKRKRLFNTMWPLLLYGGLTVGLYGLFDSIDDNRMRSLIFAMLVPIWLNFATLGAMQNAIVDIVSEKEDKMKIVQEIYGLTNGMYWLCWGGYFAVVSLVSVCVIFILFYVVKPVMTQANPVLVFIVFSAGYIQQFEFAAVMAVFFNSMQSASSLASFFNLLMTLLASAAQAWLQGKSRILWYLVSLMPCVNFFNGVSAIMWTQSLYTCENGNCSRGLTYANLFESDFCYVKPTDGSVCPAGAGKHIFSAGETIVMMVIDVVLYGFFAWWFGNVWQGDYGQAKPWTFCCNPSFMCPSRQDSAREVQRAGEGSAAGRSVAMSIHHLRKVFKDKVAVDDVSLDAYSEEIFALLGHNGAGKTTAINCVIGLVPPTSGSATVNGFDTTTDIEAARRQLSICPQDNPFYDVFTVRQHLMFFASLRGVAEDRVAESIDSVLGALGMPEKVDARCTTLSGGQKRRLWVATALLGESPIVFLDEPTSGMDPSSRRELWKLFLDKKNAGQCIIFTTHYLEEADVLADRKAVMARGRVQAIGTSRELKMHYGLGYHLRVEMQATASEDQVAQLNDTVKRYVRSAKEERSQEEERAQAADAMRVVGFTLPFNEVACFGPLLLHLEERTEALAMHDYTMAMTSLEEVFMKLGQQAEDEAGDGRNADFRDVDQDSASADLRAEASFQRSVVAMARIRLQSVMLNRRALYPAFIAPLILLVVGFLVKYGDTGTDSVLSIAIYPPMAFGIAIIPYTINIIRDKQYKIKHVSIAQGLTVRAYWIANFCAAYLCLIILVGAVILLIFIKQPTGIYGSALPLICLEVVVYPVGLILMAFNISQLFSTVEVAVKILPLMNMLGSTIPTVVVASLWLQESPLCDIAKWTHIVMSAINPVYSLPGMMVVAGLGIDSDLDTVGYFQPSWCSVPLYGSFVAILLHGTFLIWQDSRSYHTQPGNTSEFGNRHKDEDVLAEEGRIAGLPESDLAAEAACYMSLSHTYRGKAPGKRCNCGPWAAHVETHAVRGISLGVHPGECFGLLGPNGAGKTTTLSILTGEVQPPTSGSVTIGGHNMASASGMAAAYERLGLCPQVDPLWEFISGREHLRFYGRVKGVPEAQLLGPEGQVDRLLFRLGFDEADYDRAAGKYSGGMKRKLSLAIALIGQSPLLFLDEPSAAVDAGAKRHLWKVIKRRAPSQTVVLTTHSMEEAEALCDRVAIQVKGQLRCLGTPNHIKTKYGSGFQLELFCKPGGNVDSMTSFLRGKFGPETALLENHMDHYVYQLPPLGGGASVTMGRVFSEVQDNTERMSITEYSLTQPSLEQVFLRFAKEQEHDDGSV